MFLIVIKSIAKASKTISTRSFSTHGRHHRDTQQHQYSVVSPTSELITMGALQFPPGIDPDDMIGQGSSGIAALDPKTKHIIKFPFNEDEARAACDREKEIYERLERSPLPRPSSLLKYYGPRDQGILLETQSTVHCGDMHMAWIFQSHSLRFFAGPNKQRKRYISSMKMG